MVNNESGEGDCRMDAMKTGGLIKQSRIELGLTQEQLAKKINVSKAAVSKWENGKGMPDISLLEPLGNALNLSITELLKGEKTLDTEEDKETAVKEIIKDCQNTYQKRNKRMLIIAVTGAILCGLCYYLTRDVTILYLLGIGYSIYIGFEIWNADHHNKAVWLILILSAVLVFALQSKITAEQIAKRNSSQFFGTYQNHDDTSPFRYISVSFIYSDAVENEYFLSDPDAVLSDADRIYGTFSPIAGNVIQLDCDALNDPLLIKLDDKIMMSVKYQGETKVFPLVYACEIPIINNMTNRKTIDYTHTHQ